MKIIRRISKIFRDISSFWLFAAMMLICSDVFMRYFFNSPIPGTLEISEQTVIIITFLCLSFTAMQNRHIRTNVLVTRLPKKYGKMTDIISNILMILLLGLFIWQTSTEAWRSFQIKEVRMGLINVPIYPVKILIPFGFIFTFIFYFIKLLKMDNEMEPDK